MTRDDVLQLDIGDSIIGLGDWEDELPVVGVSNLFYRSENACRLVQVGEGGRCGSYVVRADDPTIRGVRH